MLDPSNGQENRVKSALILGTLAGQVDAMLVLRARGWRVHACGHARQGPGVHVADEFHLVDLLDVEAVTRLAQELDVDIVYSVGSDIAMPTVAAVSESLGLPLFHDRRVTEILHRKDLLRRFLDQIQLSPVAARVVTSGDDLRGFDQYPAIVKPVDSQGQRGITVVDDERQAIDALPRALAVSREGRAVVEEWLDGAEVSVHVFVEGHEVRFLLPSDRHVWDGPAVGIPAAHVLPATLREREEMAIAGLIDEFVTDLGVDQGPLYFQLKMTRTGPRIIEVASRLDGCHLWRLIELHTGVNLIEVCFDVLAGGRWTDPAPSRADATHALHFHLGSPHEPFHSTDHPPGAGGRVLYNEYQVDEGRLPRDTNGIVSRLGYWIEERPL